jgi:hypothetical protein
MSHRFANHSTRRPTLAAWFVATAPGLVAGLGCGEGSTRPAEPAGMGGTMSEGSGGSAASPQDDPPGASAGASGAGSQEVAPPCRGCAELQLPASMVGHQIDYRIDFPQSLDFSAASVTWRVRVLTPVDGLGLKPFAQGFSDNDGTWPYFFTSVTPESGFVDTETWVELTMDLATIGARAPSPTTRGTDAGADAASDSGSPAPSPPGDGLLPPGAFDKSRVDRVGLQVGVYDGFSGIQLVRVLVDSVTFNGVTDVVVADRTFSDGIEDLVLNDFNNPPGTSQEENLIHHPE